MDSAEDVVVGDTKLQARAGDLIRISYHDALNISAGPEDLSTAAKCVEGNLGGVRVTRTEIGDAELALKTSSRPPARSRKSAPNIAISVWMTKRSANTRKLWACAKRLPWEPERSVAGYWRKHMFSYGGFISPWTV